MMRYIGEQRDPAKLKAGVSAANAVHCNRTDIYLIKLSHMPAAKKFTLNAGETYRDFDAVQAMLVTSAVVNADDLVFLY